MLSKYKSTGVCI